MLKTIKQLLEEARATGLTDSEKLIMKESLERFIKAPGAGVRNNDSERLDIRRSIIQAQKTTFKFNYMPILIAILIALGGGTSFAAQSSLPGDALYPIKTNVNEQVQSWLSLSDEAKANWEAVLASRRLNEAEQLAAQSKLDTATRTQLETQFEDHANKAEDRIAKLATVDAKAAADIAANLQTSLEAHDRIISSIGTSKDGDTETELKPLDAKVKAEVGDASQNLVKTETEVKTGPDVQTAAQGRMTAAQNKIDEVKKFIENKKDTIGADAAAQAQTQLNAAVALMTQGQAQLDAKNYAAAFTLFGQAQAKAQVVKLLVGAKADFEHEDGNTSTPTASTSVSPSPSSSATASPSPSPTNRGKDHGSEDNNRVKIDIELD